MNPDEMPTCNITFIIPVKDRLDELRSTVSSVYSQTLLPSELIIVDDCSDIAIRPEQLPEPPVGVSLKILRNNVNLGGAQSMNRASLEVKTPFMAFLDSDDYLFPKYVERVFNGWKNGSHDTVLIGTGFLWCTYALIPYRKQSVTSEVTHRDLLIYGNTVGGSSIMSVRRDAFLSVGGHPLCRGSHDWGLLIKLAKIGKIKTIPEPLVLYRSPTTNPKPTYTKSYRKQIIAIGYIYRTQPIEDRVVLRSRIRILTLNYLAKMGRRRMAMKIFRSVIYNDRKVTPEVLGLLILIVIGPRAYDRILFNYAMLRARVFGKKLLASRKNDT